jgi:hypothetical protein
MDRRIIMSTAYLPPIEYIARIINAQEILIEREENYHKQSFRNRCYIQGVNNFHLLTVPVYKGSLLKTCIKDVRIDYSKRWQQVHLGAMRAAYGLSPFFIYYFEKIEKIINSKKEFLLDLNIEILNEVLVMMNSQKKISFTSEFIPEQDAPGDLRYSINPKLISSYKPKDYIRVFSTDSVFINGLSIIDLLFSTGPDAALYL